VIIDAHCHVWPDHIARAVLASRPAGLPSVHDGTVDGLLRMMDGAGIDRVLALGVASVAKNVDRTNEFIGGLDRDRFVPFGTVHPDLAVDDNLASLRDHGIVGVKLHPLFQDLTLDDPRVLDIVAVLAAERIPVITHAGSGGDDAANDRGAPRRLRTLLDSVPGLTLLACHFGGYHRLNEARELIVGSSAFLETSWPPRLADVDPDLLREIIAEHGADRVVYGSDWPMADPAGEIEAIRALGLPAADTAAILGGNLARVLGLTV
jgi:hypothetical protein